MSISFTPHEKYSRLKKGIFFVLIAWFFFAIMYLLGKWCTSQTTISTMVFFRNCVGMLIAFPWMLLDYKNNFKTSRPIVVIVRGIAGTLNTVFIFFAVQTISLVDSTLLTNCAPLFVPIIGWICLKKKIIHALWLPMIIGLVGIIFILKPDVQIFNKGAFYGIASGMTTALSLLMVRMATHTEKMQTTLFYAYFIGVILSVPFLLFYWSTPSHLIFWALVGIGVSSFLGQWLLFKALQYGKATPISSFGYSCVVYAGIFDWLLYRQVPDLFTWIGAILVIMGGIWVLFISRPQQ